MRILQVKNNLLLFYVYMLSKYYPKRFVCVIPAVILVTQVITACRL